MSETKTAMEILLEELRDSGALHDEDAIREKLHRVPRKALEGMSYQWFNVARSKWERNQTLAIERRVLSTAPAGATMGDPSTMADGTLRPYSTEDCNNPDSLRGMKYLEDKKIWEKNREELNEKYRQEEEERSLRAKDNMDRAIEDYKSSLYDEWTAELLEQSIAMPDGTRTTWGAATLSQHQERLAMFKSQAVAGIAGAARHKKAIQEIESSGARCLLDVHPAAMVA